LTGKKFPNTNSDDFLETTLFFSKKTFVEVLILSPTKPYSPSSLNLIIPDFESFGAYNLRISAK